MREASESQTATGTDSHAFFVQSFNADEENPEAQKIIMNVPKLTMSKEDVEKAISRAFQQQFPNLTFTKGMSFSKVDPDGQCSLFLPQEYCYKGDYNIQGIAKLYDKESITSKCYHIEGRVHVDEDNGSPKITFNQPFTANGR